MAHLDAVPFRELEKPLTSDEVRMASLSQDAELIAGLPYGHAEMVLLAVDRLRQDYARVPDPAGLLAEPFTLKELRDLHEAVAGRHLIRDTFRRQMEPQPAATREISDGTLGRPSRLWGRGI